MKLIKLKAFDVTGLPLGDEIITDEPPMILVNPDQISIVESWRPYRNPERNLKSQIKLVDGECYYSLNTPEEIYEIMKEQQAL